MPGSWPVTAEHFAARVSELDDDELLLVDVCLPGYPAGPAAPDIWDVEPQELRGVYYRLDRLEREMSRLREGAGSTVLVRPPALSAWLLHAWAELRDMPGPAPGTPPPDRGAPAVTGVRPES